MERNESLDQDELFDDYDDDDDYDEEVADLPIFKSERSEDISNKEKHRETFVRFDGGNKCTLCGLKDFAWLCDVMLWDVM